MTRRIVITFLFLLMAASGCAPSSLQGSFLIVEETRQFTTPFDAVVLDNVGELTLTFSDRPGIFWVRGDDNLVEALEVTINNGVLTIDFEGDVPVVPSRPFLMTLSVGSLKAITLDHPEGFIDLTEPMETKQLAVTLIGDGDINLEAVTADQLTVTIQGDGTVYASGVVREQFVSMRDGFGWYYADDLRSEYATVELYGGVNARVWVRQILTPELTGGAKLFYFGSPLVQADDDPLGLVDMGKK